MSKKIFKKFINGRFRNYISYICSDCQKRCEARADHTNKSGLCKKCSARNLLSKMNSKQMQEHPGYKNGVALYRKIAYQKFLKKCQICKITKNILIHHIDQNRLNNDISNLYPVCRSCHMLLHKYYKNGKSHVRSIGYVKMKVTLRKKHK